MRPPLILGTLSHLNSLTTCTLHPRDAPAEASASSQHSQLSGRPCNISAGGKLLGRHRDS